MTTALSADPHLEAFLADACAGLARPKKQLLPKYFYDEAGSRLFDRITELDEYYPTRTELAITRTHAGEMARASGADCLLVELGAGSLTKVRLLIEKLDRPAGYVPVDVSGDHLRAAANRLSRGFPKLAIHPVVADFTARFELPPVPSTKRVVYFPGSTIGNFEPREADALFARVASLVGVGGGLLLGVDLQKNVDVLERAYNDSRGVTAAFNRNVLVRMNRELGADFDLDAFRHHAFYNRERHRIEMHLVSTRDQVVRVGEASFAFRSGESIHTENSYKFHVPALADRMARRGWRLDAHWTDADRFFAVLYFTYAGSQSA